MGRLPSAKSGLSDFRSTPDVQLCHLVRIARPRVDGRKPANRDQSSNRAVGMQQDRLGNRDAEYFGGPAVDQEVELGPLLCGKIGRLGVENWNVIERA